MGILEDCNKYFGAKNLYEVLGIPKDASDAEVKKAYKKASLLCHPDRNPDNIEEATRKFQTLAKVHCVLSDKEQRTVYDETGSIDEEDCRLDRDWYEYWRLLFPKITEKDIDKFMKNYIGSEEEKEDLKRVYVQYEGDMNKISEAFIGYTADEEEKYVQILKEMIENEEVPDFPKFSKEKQSKKNARIKRFKKEAEECEEINDSLKQALAQRSVERQSNFDDMMKGLEEKYCKKTTKTKKKK